MSINIYTVTNHLAEEGWKLLSTVYKNLTTELEMECPEGHKQLQTYGNWRKHPLCEQCMAGDPYKIKKNKVPAKTADTQRILALDAATNITGFAIFDDGELVSYGVFKTNSENETNARINELKKWLQTAIRTWEPNFIGVDFLPINCFSVSSTGSLLLYNG